MFRVGDRVKQLEDSEWSVHNFTGVQIIEETNHNFNSIRFKDSPFFNIADRFEKCAAPVGQTKLQSLVESFANILIGYTIAILAQMVIFPLFDIHVSHGEHMVIGLLFTMVSLMRSYSLRRLFNRLHRN